MGSKASRFVIDSRTLQAIERGEIDMERASPAFREAVLALGISITRKKKSGMSLFGGRDESDDTPSELETALTTSLHVDNSERIKAISKREQKEMDAHHRAAEEHRRHENFKVGGREIIKGNKVIVEFHVERGKKYYTQEWRDEHGW